MKNLYKTFLAIALGIFSLQAQALVLSPDVDCTAADLGVSCWTTTDNTNLTVDEVATLIGYTGTLEEYYKGDADGAADEGAFAGSYDTTFSSGNADALIEHIIGTSSISCPDCFILIKDGKKNPAQYVFDISDWNGIDAIDLQDFWLAADGTGAISHVSIYGGAPSQVPEPQIAALLGLGLLGMVVARRKMKV